MATKPKTNRNLADVVAELKTEAHFEKEKARALSDNSSHYNYQRALAYVGGLRDVIYLIESGQTDKIDTHARDAMYTYRHTFNNETVSDEDLGRLDGRARAFAFAADILAGVVDDD